MTHHGKQGSKRLRRVQVVACAAVAAGSALYASEGRAEEPVREPARAPLATPEAPPLPASTAARSYDIPAGSLSEVLHAYEQITGVRVVLKLPVGGDQGIQSPGVSGSFTDDAALRLLLTKTGLSYHFEGLHRVEVSIRNTEQVDVTATAPMLSLNQFPEPVLDTAQTINMVPQYILQEQAATTLRDGLRNVPGISMAAGEGGAQGDTLTIRGFNARNDIFLDGIRDFGSYYRDAFDYESIDVLQGPAGVEFGRGSTGGIVNQETKQPLANEFVHVGAQFGTNLMRRVTADINEPLKDFGNGVAFRLNVVGTQSNVAERQITETRRFGIAPSLIFGLNTPTRYTVQYLHESENTTPDYGLPYFGPGVPAVDRSTYYGFAADNYLRTNPDIMTGKVEHDVNSHIVVRNELRWANYPRDVRITEPLINTTATLANPTAIGGAATATCAQASTAAASCYALNTPLSQVTVKRNQLTSRSTEDLLWDQASGSFNFHLFGIDNDAVVIVEGGRERSDPNRNSYTVPYVPLINPNPYDPFAPTTTVPGVTTHVATQSFGAGFNDTVKVREWLQLSGGVRFDYFNANSTTPANFAATPVTAATSGNRLDRQPTYRAAIAVKPKPQGSIYFDYGTSFNPSAESLSLSANNALAAPEENQTFELGAKWSYMRDRLNLSGSLFRTEKQNAHETDPNNSNNTLTVGTYLVRGVQVGAIGHLPRNFDLILGYAYLNGYLEYSGLNASPFNAVNVALIALHDPRANTAPYFINPTGFPLANVPKNSGNIWLTHRLFAGVTGGFGGNYLSARRASSSSLIGVYNTSAPTNLTQVPLVAKSIPGYWVFSAMVRRPINERIDLQANIQNLTNKFFIDEPHPNHLVPGEGLNAQFGLNYKF
jgi:catecholate siderophore receptor